MARLVACWDNNLDSRTEEEEDSVVVVDDDDDDNLWPSLSLDDENDLNAACWMLSIRELQISGERILCCCWHDNKNAAADDDDDVCTFVPPLSSDRNNIVSQTRFYKTLLSFGSIFFLFGWVFGLKACVLMTVMEQGFVCASFPRWFFLANPKAHLIDYLF